MLLLVVPTTLPARPVDPPLVRRKYTTAVGAAVNTLLLSHNLLATVVVLLRPSVGFLPFWKVSIAISNGLPF